MNMLTLMDGTQPITLWHHQDDSTTEIPVALIRRYRHRLYSQVVDTAVPVNYSHWYFAVSDDATHPLPGDEITDPNGAVWTILEVNHSPLTGVWQVVCETFAFAEPTEHVDHLRANTVIAELLPVRTGPMIETLEPDTSKRLTFYVPPSNNIGAIAVQPDDVLRRLDGSRWKIVRVEHPKYRARWTAVVCVLS